MNHKILSPTSDKLTSKRLCKICGEKAKSYHFGALTCSACAAFFRRTVASQRTYTCKLKDKCKLVNVLCRRICKFCRFERCLDVGMKPSEVRSVSCTTSSSEEASPICIPSPLSQALSNKPGKNRTKSFGTQSRQLNKMHLLSDLLKNSAIANPVNHKFSKTNISATLSQTSQYICPEIFSVLQATILESLVCTAYLYPSTLYDYLSGKDHTNIFDQASTSWINMDVCDFICRNNKDQENEMINVSDKFVHENLRFLQKFYQLGNTIQSSEWIKKFKKPLWQKNLDLAKLLQSSKLDEYKFAVLAHLTLIRIAREILESKSELQIEFELSTNVKMLSKDIEQYYLLNYSATSFVKLIKLVDEMQELRKIYNKHVLIIFLSQKIWKKRDNEQIFVTPLNIKTPFKDCSFKKSKESITVPELPMFKSRNKSSVISANFPHHFLIVEALKTLLVSKINNQLQHDVPKNQISTF